LPQGMSHTLFLLGSGASLEAGMPSVAAITDKVLDGGDAAFGSDRVFHRTENPPEHERPEVERVLALLRELGALELRASGAEPNYEQLSSLVGQLADAMSGEYETALALPVREELERRPYAGPSLGELCELARGYIADTVCHLLSQPLLDVTHLGAITTACRALPSIDIATLNHDLVLDTTLAHAGIGVADGFGPPEHDLRPWGDDWSTAAISLIKLHGSIDWWAYQLASRPWRSWVTTRLRAGGDPFHPAHPEAGFPFDGRPILLTGTFDKILAYERWIFPDQHARFHDGLRRAETVVVVGYGFGDKAVNSRLIGWMDRRPANRLVVCDPDPCGLLGRARMAIQNNWQYWQNEGRLKLLPAKIGDLGFADLESHVRA
jgi:hypothetical protein